MTFAKFYFKLLKDKYLQEILVIPSTIAVIIIEAANRNSFSWLDALAILLPVSYLIYMFYNVYESAVSLSTNLQSGYSLCLGKSEVEFIDSIRKQVDVLQSQKINLPTVFAHFRVIDSDWQYHEEARTRPTEWNDCVAQVNEHFLRYAQRVPINTKLHLFLIAPCPVAIGLGFTLGKHRPWIVYHYDRRSSQYQSIYHSNLGFSPVKNTYKHIKIVSKGAESQEVMIDLSFVAKANISLPHKAEQIIEITPKVSEISPSDFVSIAAEIVDYLNKLLKQGKTLHLFPGLPIALGFVIGREFDEPANVLIYNLNRSGDWECVLNLPDLLA